MIPDAAMLVAHNLHPSKRLAMGCIVAVAAYLAMVAVLGMAVLAVGMMNSDVVQASLMRAMRPYVLAPSLAMLDARHTADERAAFSNAVAVLFDRMEAEPLSGPSNVWMRETLESLVAAQKDKVILQNESAAFCTTVWAHAAAPAAAPAK